MTALCYFERSASTVSKETLQKILKDHRTTAQYCTRHWLEDFPLKIMLLFYKDALVYATYELRTRG